MTRMTRFAKKKKEKKFDIALSRINYFLLFAFCFLLYMPNFKIPPIFLNLLSYGLPILLILINIKTLRHISVRQVVLLLCAALLVLLSCILPVLYGTEDFSYTSVLLGSCRQCLAYVALLCLTIRVHGKEKSLYYFMYYYILTHVVYMLVTVLMVVFPNLQDIWFSIVDKNSDIQTQGSYIFRIGWQGFSGFRLTLHCTFSVIFALFLRYGGKNPIISGKQFILLIAACFVGNMFYGRSGLMISIVMCVATLFFQNRHRLKRIVISILSVILIIGGISLLKYIPGLSSWYDWMSSPIVNLVTTGDMKDGSFDRLQEMHQVEISNEAFAFGDARYMSGDNEYYMDTDVGFIRNILFWGVIGAVLSYGATLYAIFGFGKINKLLMLQFLITFIAFEYKGAVYYEFLSLAFAIETAFVAMSYNDSVRKALP